MAQATPYASDLKSLDVFHPGVRTWFTAVFDAPTVAQEKAWPIIASGANTLLLAPTGSGKTLAAFLVAIDRLMFGRDAEEDRHGVRVLYISPLKALAVDVERNLRSPLAGVNMVAVRDAIPHHPVQVGVRSGDTEAKQRRQLHRDPPDILITTPESLYLLLTSRAREMLARVETVIIDEIHSLVPSKRGAHLCVSLERLENLRRAANPSAPPLQRIGLSATQRPLEEVGRLLVGAEPHSSPDGPLRQRPLEIIDASYGKALDIQIEVPVEDMARLSDRSNATNNANATPAVPSIWPAIHPRLVELIRQHRSTIVFCNSRRLAERLATAINETAEEELALAHHGSIAKQTRLTIEDRLKRGELPAIVATSSLELGIDMGAVDLVIQVESPPSIAAGIQRIGRASHHVGGQSTGIMFPKYRGDLLAASAAVRRMLTGDVEPTSYPRNPLDVLAQQIVAMVALEPMAADEIYRTVRRAAHYQDLPRPSFDGVLDLLAGRYPSDQFAELRPRLTWDRLSGVVSPRQGTQRIAVLNAGTIPDRGLYGVYLSDGQGGSMSRVGELDEEMVFESRVGECFLLGASSWRVVDITHDRVLVVPAPGEPGRMPFWRGDGPGRPVEFGRAIGQLARQLARMQRGEAQKVLTEEHRLDARAATNLLSYLNEQMEATGDVPSDTTLIVECFVDEVGDWRVVILSPYGSRIHAPWAMAIAGRLRRQTMGEVDVMWTDDGIVLRLPESDTPPALEMLLPMPDEIEDMVTRELPGTALFAGRFRENAARALLLPRHRAQGRTPLWIQRRRAADLLAVAAQFPSFPMLLETFRECLRDVFDLPGLRQILRDIQGRSINVRYVYSKRPSPFAASLLFSYTANFLYEGDAPLAERRAQTLALDHAQLRELLGDAEMRELLDAEVVQAVALQLQRLDGKRLIQHPDQVHDTLLQLGDMTVEELAARSPSELVASGELAEWIAELKRSRRIVEIRIGGQPRLAAVEDISRYRDALGVIPPPGIADAFLESTVDPLGDLISRYARTHGPFPLEDVARRFAVGVSPVRVALENLFKQDRVVEGEFTPGGRGREWCDVEVLRSLKRRSLAKLRKQIEPAAHDALAKFLPRWQGITQPRTGLDALLDTIQQIQGLPLPASALERWILPARVLGYRPGDLDQLCLAGEVLWRGCESLGGQDGRIALYLTDHFTTLGVPPTLVENETAATIRDILAQRGAVFFDEIARQIGGFRQDVLSILWDMVWAGEVTNDTLAPLRSLNRAASKQRKSRTAQRAFRSRRTQTPAGSEGRWSLLWPAGREPVSATERQTSIARQLIERYGIVTREAVASEGIPGGFAGLYPVFKAMEESGRIRRGYFVAGLGAAQFAAPGADERLRERESAEDEGDLLILAATDPANPFGAALPWPTRSDALRPQRAAGTRVIIHEGRLLGVLGRSNDQLLTFLTADEQQRQRERRWLLRALERLAQEGEPIYLTLIDGSPPGDSAWAAPLMAVGFAPSSRGYLLRPVRSEQPVEHPPSEVDH